MRLYRPGIAEIPSASTVFGASRTPPPTDILRAGATGTTPLQSVSQCKRRAGCPHPAAQSCTVFLVKNNVIANQCAHWCGNPYPRLCHADRGSLSFCGERKGGKNAAKTHGFEILSAAGVLTVPVPSCPANWSVQNLCLAFAWSLRLIPRRALRLCWPGGTGKTSAPIVRRDVGIAPYAQKRGPAGWQGPLERYEICDFIRNPRCPRCGDAAPRPGCCSRR